MADLHVSVRRADGAVIREWRRKGSMALVALDTGDGRLLIAEDATDDERKEVTG